VNFLRMRFWEHPDFLRMVVLPLVPCLIGALVIFVTSFSNLQRDRNDLWTATVQTNQVQQAPSVQQRIGILNRIHDYDNALRAIYAQRSSGQRLLEPLERLASVMPLRRMRIQTVGIMQNQLAITLVADQRQDYVALNHCLATIGGTIVNPTTSQGNNGQTSLTATFTFQPQAQNTRKQERCS
jgi:hypothetical protein